MSTKEIKILVRRWMNKMNEGKEAAIAAVEEFHVTDYVSHGGTGEDIHGLEEFKQSISDFYSAFHDVHFSIHDMIVEGDKVAVRLSFSGTHKGELVGIPPADKKWTMWGIYILRIVDGKFAESWARYDTLGFMYQIWGISTPKEENQI